MRKGISKMAVPTASISACVKDTKDVEAMVKKNYGLTVTSLKALDGYEDVNFHAKVEAEHTNGHIQHIDPHGYVVKIINELDSKSEEFVLAQKIVMEHLNSHGIKCQEKVLTLDGSFVSSIDLDRNGEMFTYLVVLRTYISGDILANVTLTTSLANDVGLMTANMAKAFQEFEYPFYKDHTPSWNLDKFLNVQTVADAVKDTAQRQVVEQVFTAFKAGVLHRKGEYQKGQIHGDINEQNILVEETGSGTGFTIAGILDFQDTAHSCVLYDVAIAIAYMMMLPKCEVPILDIGGHILASYESVFPLNDAERESMKTVVASRMVMSLVYGAHFHSLDPTNDYLLVTSKVGWTSLLLFWKTPEDVLWKRWNEIIQSYSN